MAVFITHGIFPSLLTFLWKDKKTKFSIFLLIFVASILPDIDFIFQETGSKMFSHRGITHSLFFAAMTGTAFSALYLSVLKTFGQTLLLLFIFFLASASHIFLDSLTEAQYGVCVFCPFSDERFFFPFTLFSTSSSSGVRTGFRPGLGNTAWSSIFPEILWVWLPSIGMFILSNYLKGNDSDSSNSSGGSGSGTYKPVQFTQRKQPKIITRSSRKNR